MIVVDSSALIAILDQEEDASRYAEALRNADRLVISAVNVHETGIILRFRLDENDFEIVALREVHAREALAAFSRNGKGIDSKARLSLADCAAYALARRFEAPLLFKGEDFAATDIPVCLRLVDLRSVTTDPRRYQPVGSKDPAAGAQSPT